MDSVDADGLSRLGSNISTASSNWSLDDVDVTSLGLDGALSSVLPAAALTSVGVLPAGATTVGSGGQSAREFAAELQQETDRRQNSSCADEARQRLELWKSDRAAERREAELRLAANIYIEEFATTSAKTQVEKARLQLQSDYNADCGYRAKLIVDRYKMDTRSGVLTERYREKNYTPLPARPLYQERHGQDFEEHLLRAEQRGVWSIVLTPGRLGEDSPAVRWLGEEEAALVAGWLLQAQRLARNQEKLRGAHRMHKWREAPKKPDGVPLSAAECQANGLPTSYKKCVIA